MIKQYKNSAEQTTIPSCFFPQRPLPKHNVTTSKWGTWPNPKDPPTGTGYPAIPTPMIIFPKHWGSFRRNFCFGQTQNHIVDHTISYIHIQLDLIIIILSIYYTTYNHIYIYIITLDLHTVERLVSYPTNSFATGPVSTSISRLSKQGSKVATPRRLAVTLTMASEHLLKHHQSPNGGQMSSFFMEEKLR
jgi:hypothetical protein